MNTLMNTHRSTCNNMIFGASHSFKIDFSIYYHGYHYHPWLTQMHWSDDGTSTYTTV